SKFFVSYRTWSVLGFSALTGTFGRLLVLFALLPAETQKSFFCLSAWRSSIIPYAGPDVNTFLQVFSGFFALTQIGFILLDSLCKASRHRRQNKNPTDVSCSSVGFRETSSHELFRRLKKGITILKDKVKVIP
uniref:hypothetical protein n=1 Tax=Faecalibacterium prausnitzii TaxID=853 RepID=UPI003FEEAA70